MSSYVDRLMVDAYQKTQELFPDEPQDVRRKIAELMVDFEPISRKVTSISTQDFSSAFTPKNHEHYVPPTIGDKKQLDVIEKAVLSTFPERDIHHREDEAWVSKVTGAIYNYAREHKHSSVSL